MNDEIRNKNEDERLLTDINNLGEKVGNINTSFQICKAEKGKDISQLQDRCDMIEGEQKSMMNEIKELVQTQNKLFGALVIIIFVLQIAMPIVIQKLFK